MASLRRGWTVLNLLDYECNIVVFPIQRFSGLLSAEDFAEMASLHSPTTLKSWTA